MSMHEQKSFYVWYGLFTFFEIIKVHRSNKMSNDLFFHAFVLLYVYVFTFESHKNDNYLLKNAMISKPQNESGAIVFQYKRNFSFF